MVHQPEANRILFFIMKIFRTILFILFCSLWVCMFAAAFVIVILSPKCSAKKEPEWWRTKLSYQVKILKYFIYLFIR